MLTWDWNKRIGTLTVKGLFQDKETKEIVSRPVDIDLYEGNAYLIGIQEYTDEKTGEDMYTMYTFFSDNIHAKRCLGIDKKDKSSYGDNLYKDKWLKISLSKKYRYLKEFTGYLVDAFDNLEIEIYTDKEPD